MFRIRILSSILLLSIFTIQFIYGHRKGTEHLQIVSRNEWKADPPSVEIPNLKLPVNTVVIIHTASSFCENQIDCSSRVKSIQHFHMKDQEFDDISYNFLIGGDGNVYEGRGWNKIGAHSKGYNNGTLGIAFIGNYMEIEPTKKQLDVTKLLLKYGVELNKLTVDYNLYGHRQLRPTLSPGDNLYKIIKTWEHWCENV